MGSGEWEMGKDAAPHSPLPIPHSRSEKDERIANGSARVKTGRRRPREDRKLRKLSR